MRLDQGEAKNVSVNFNLTDVVLSYDRIRRGLPLTAEYFAREPQLRTPSHVSDEGYSSMWPGSLPTFAPETPQFSSNEGQLWDTTGAQSMPQVRNDIEPQATSATSFDHVSLELPSAGCQYMIEADRQYALGMDQPLAFPLMATP